MTKLEKMVGLAIKDHELFISADFQQDAVERIVRQYLAERNDAIAAQLPADHATTMQAAANAFDNADVDEPADDEANVFVEMFGYDPEKEFDKIKTDTFHKEAHA